MKIAIIGYGRMGHIVEKIAKERGHKVCCVIDADNIADFESHDFRKADVAIEFSTPSSAVDNILKAFVAGVPVVSGTTGWSDYLDDVRRMCNEGKGTLLYASNFSIGVNIFMAVNRYLSRLMNHFPGYSTEVAEVHHVHKLDHPSGTAITLAEDLITTNNRLAHWQEFASGEQAEKSSKTKVLPVFWRREGEVPGIHTISWESEADSISITHDARTREGFAMGAVLAAEWLKGKKGFFSFSDMLNDEIGEKGIF